MSIGKLTDLTVHEDARGSVVELLADRTEHSPRGRQLLLTTARPRQVKGNHYHTRKTEWFCVLAGSMRVELAERATGRRESLDLASDRPQLLEIPPGVTHALRNTGEGDLLVLVYVDEAFDREDPDTFPEALVEPTP